MNAVVLGASALHSKALLGGVCVEAGQNGLRPHEAVPAHAPRHAPTPTGTRPDARADWSMSRSAAVSSSCARGACMPPMSVSSRSDTSSSGCLTAGRVAPPLALRGWRGRAGLRVPGLQSSEALTSSAARIAIARIWQASIYASHGLACRVFGG